MAMSRRWGWGDGDLTKVGMGVMSTSQGWGWGDGDVTKALTAMPCLMKCLLLKIRKDRMDGN